MSSSATDLLEVTMPQMGVSVAEGTLVAWHVAVGDAVAADQTICEVSTDKIDTEVPAPAAGTVVELVAELEQTLPVGALLARLSMEGAPGRLDPALSAAAPTAPGPAPAPSPNGHGHARHHSPVVRRIAAERHLDLDAIAGSGRDGRVTKRDVLAALADRAPTPEPPLHIESPYRPDPDPRVVPEPVPDPPPGGTLSRMRRSIGEHMKRSLDTAATCTTWMEADLTAVEAARREAGRTALPYVAAATVRALGTHPALNATLEGDRYTRHSAVHLGIAVSLGEAGLIVPVIRDAQRLSVDGLAAAIRDLAGRARSGRLGPDEVRGATFTITNPGQYGSLMATPVINQPQVAILDLEAVVKRPVVLTLDGVDTIAIRSMTVLGMSWDHRALDGVEAARFLATLRADLETAPR